MDRSSTFTLFSPRRSGSLRSGLHLIFNGLQRENSNSLPLIPFLSLFLCVLKRYHAMHVSSKVCEPMLRKVAIFRNTQYREVIWTAVLWEAFRLSTVLVSRYR